MFDPDGEYPSYDVRFDQRVFIRFIEYPACLAHVVHHTTVLQRDVHLFFSSRHHQQLLQLPPTELDQAMKYVYCRDQVTKDQILTDYGRRLDRKIILDEDLEFELAHIQVKLLYALMKDLPEDSEERDQCGQAICNTLEETCCAVKKIMSSIPAGEAPTEIDIQTDDLQSTLK